MLRDHLLSFADVVQEVGRVGAPREIVQVLSPRDHDLLIATVISNIQSAPELEPIEFLTTGEGNALHEEVVAQVRAEHSVQVL